MAGADTRRPADQRVLSAIRGVNLIEVNRRGTGLRERATDSDAVRTGAADVKFKNVASGQAQPIVQRQRADVVIQQ